MLIGMDYAIGCTIATRRAEIEAIGGLEEMQSYLSEDFVIGNRMHGSGRKVILSRSVIEHYIGDDSMRKNWGHRLRWARGSRRSRPTGYIGEIFTKPALPALALWILAPGWGALAMLALALRLVVAWNALRLLAVPKFRRRWWLLPVEDVWSFATWALGFFGDQLTWRGHKLTIARDGTIESSV
jgi:ceramide glucosyltransferase